MGQTEQFYTATFGPGSKEMTVRPPLRDPEIEALRDEESALGRLVTGFATAEDGAATSIDLVDRRDARIVLAGLNEMAAARLAAGHAVPAAEHVQEGF